MEFGVTMFPTDYSMQPADLAVAVEERGFDALYFPDHTHIPSSRISPFRTGGDLPPDYYHNADMFLSLAAAAAVTKKIRLGTGVCLVIERDPIVLAKEVASLDHISGGRVDFGVGAGWNAEEMANHGIDFGRRWKVLRERIEAMQAIWTQEEASYAGELVKFDSIWSRPKPVQKPHPPIFVGGDGKGTFKRVMRYGDGWIPMLDNGDVSIEYLTEKLTRLREMAAEADRPAPLITTFAAPRDPGYIAQLRELGVNRCMFGFKAAPAEEVLPRLDKLLATLRQVA